MPPPDPFSARAADDRLHNELERRREANAPATCSWCWQRPAQPGKPWCAQCEERRHEYAADAEGDEDA